ncbi:MULTISPECIES: hypothetical protein [unclassified Streptomyces]|uniref:hypothetical protein n=1 Tax=unclassified Streptomyces TaxID=2593676 RepID=UPI0033AF67AB
MLAGATPVLVHNCGEGKWSSDDPDVGELANAIEERYPGHVVDVNHSRDGVEIDIETANAIIEVKGGNGSGLTKQIERRQGPSPINPEGKPVFGYARNMGRASKSINEAGGVAAGGRQSTLEELLEVLAP